MKKQLITNQEKIQKVITLGELFSVSIEDALTHPTKNRVYFIKDDKQIGFLLEKDGEDVFELSTKCGVLTGNVLEDGTSFSLKTDQKYYDMIQGKYLFDLTSTNKAENQSIACCFRKNGEVVLSMNLMNNTVFSIHKSYLHSPQPYEDISIQKRPYSFLYAHQKREGRKRLTHVKAYQFKETAFYEFGDDSYQKQNKHLKHIYHEIKKKDKDLPIFINQLKGYLTLGDTDLYENFLVTCLSHTSYDGVLEMLGVNQDLSGKVYQKMQG